MTSRIAMFNHKGGVGKTINAYHLGWMLTKLGHRVLLVDGDSQVNLTAISLGVERFDAYYDDSATRELNIKDGIAPIFEGRPTSIQAFDCPSAKNNTQLMILPGHADLAGYEGQLSLAQETGGALSVLKNLPGAINHLITEIEARHSTQFTIVDLNPGLGALNQNMFTMCDGFIVPTNPDPFSLMAIKTLGEHVVKWNQWKQHSIPIFADSSHPLREGTTKFLGNINSRFNKHASKAASKYDERIRQIDDAVNDELIVKLATAGMMFTAAKYEYAFQNFIGPAPSQNSTSKFALARIPDFQALVHRANSAEVPVFEVSEEFLRSEGLGGASLANALANKTTFFETYDMIARKIVYLFS